MGTARMRMLHSRSAFHATVRKVQRQYEETVHEHRMCD
jgi:hypothetical protein